MIAAALLGFVVTAPSQAQNGLQLPAATHWPQWQGRLALGLGTQHLNDSNRLRGSSVLGDYYFYRHPITSPTSPLGGFRATSGIMFGNTAARLSTGLGADLPSGHGLGLSRAFLGHQPWGLSNENDHAASYLGLGYSLVSLRGGWGLSADIGFAASTRVNSKLGSGPGLRQSSFEDGLRDWRLTPLLQLGLSYTF
jgi:hypothetical protein